MSNPKWVLRKTLTHIGPKPPKAPRYIRERTGEDPQHLDWIRAQSCAIKTFPIEGATACELGVEAHHHTGGRGRGQKAPDRHAIPLCGGHHREFHSASKTFAGRTKAWRRAWQDGLVSVFATGAKQ